jgi:D-alanine-D-alanine ligase
MKVTVLLGGTSAERDVSIVSGLRVAGALRARGYAVRVVDTAAGEMGASEEARLRNEGVKTAPPSLEALKVMSRKPMSALLMSSDAVTEADVIFLALHGGQGEDGTIQALLDLMGVRYTGSGHMASAVAMDKDFSKHLLRVHGVPTPDWQMAPAGEEDVRRGLGFPVVVKSSKQGSTVGLSVVRSATELQAAIGQAYLYDDEVMVERYVAGRELTVGVLGDRALPVGEIFPVHEVYDYECKYTSGMAREEFPAQLGAGETEELQELALRSFRALKLSGYARIDFRMAGDGTFFCLEANTLPGLTQLSLVPQAAAADGIDFPELCHQIVQLAVGPTSR